MSIQTDNDLPNKQVFPARIDPQAHRRRGRLCGQAMLKSTSESVPGTEQIDVNYGSAQRNHKGVRLDLRAIDREIRNCQIQFRQDLDGVRGELVLADLLCTVEP
jgi:hypothetical protein